MIQSKPESIEQIRERIRKMSDAELRKFGRAAQDHPIRRNTSAHGIRPSKFNWMRPGQNGVEGTRPVPVDAVLGCPTCRGDVRGNRAA